VPFVNRYAYAGYLRGYGDNEYLETIRTRKFTIDEDIIPHGHYVCFEVKGDSMFDGSAKSLCDGDNLLCRLIQPDLYKDSLLHFKLYNFVIVTKDGILVKQIIDHDVERGLITIHSLNPLYEDTVIALKVDGKAIVRKVDTADESSLSVVDAHGTCTAIDVSGVIYRATKVERSI
jgi:hypothetical protein